MTDSPKPKVFRFADLELDEGQQSVRRNGAPITLPKLSFDLLLALLEAAPNYLSHKQLMARVWPGLVVGDKTVNQRVKLLRDALGDDPEEWKYVGGLRGRGYRILPRVVCIGGGKESEPVARPADTAQARPAGAWVRAVAVMTVLAGIAWWQWPANETASPSADNREASLADKDSGPTVAVLPFRDLGSAASDAYIALAIPEMVIDEMSTVPGLSVIARSSSFKVADEGLAAQDIGRRLGASYLVDGSVLRNGDSLRVAAQLVDTRTGVQVWAAHFDQGIDDIFAIQDQIAGEVSVAIGAHVARLDGASSLSTQNIDAYLAYLRGRVMLARWTVADADAAIKAFESATRLDPEFAAAYAWLYDAKLMAQNRRSGSANISIARLRGADEPGSFRSTQTGSQALIEKALSLDPASGAAYFARAIWSDGDASARDADFRRGTELDPSNGRGLTAYAEFLDREGRRDEAERMLARAIRIDPLSPRAHFWSVMRQMPFDAVDAEAGMLKVLEIDPNYVPALQRYAKYRWIMHGELAEAIPLIEHAIELDPTNPWLLHTAVAMYLDLREPESARELLSRAERPELAGQLLVLLYDGDRLGAGLAALDDTAFSNGLYENWGVYESLRDWAVETGDYSRALEQLDHYTALLDEEVIISQENFRAVPAVAQILMLRGNQEQARNLLGQCIRWIDDVHLPRLSTVFALRVKASALMLLGESDLALRTLQESFTTLDFLQWWYTLERDPLWASHRGTPKFEAITRMVDGHIAQQRVLLDEQRRQGMAGRRNPAEAADSYAGINAGSP